MRSPRGAACLGDPPRGRDRRAGDRQECQPFSACRLSSSAARSWVSPARCRAISSASSAGEFIRLGDHLSGPGPVLIIGGFPGNHKAPCSARYWSGDCGAPRARMMSTIFPPEQHGRAARSADRRHRRDHGGNLAAAAARDPGRAGDGLATTSETSPLARATRRRGCHWNRRARRGGSASRTPCRRRSP